MARSFTRRYGPWGAAMMLWDVYRRLPPKQRKWVLQQVRTHGPRVAKQAMAARKNRRR